MFHALNCYTIDIPVPWIPFIKDQNARDFGTCNVFQGGY